MIEPLKILMLEDSATDTEIVQRLLKKEKLNFESKLAMSKEAFLQALDQFQPDVILADNSLPQFNATEALEITRQHFNHIPFIMVTGTVSEEFAAAIIKSGADDYILKDRLQRLPAAILAAINKRKAEKEIADYKYALDQSSIISITDQKGIIKYANENFCKISKYSVEELVGQDHRIINSCFHSKSYIKNLWTTIANGKIWRGEFCNKAKDGTRYWVDATIVPFLNEKGKPYQYLAIRTDITERKNAKEDKKKSEKLFQSMVENNESIIALLDDKFQTIYRSPASARITGWQDEERENAGTHELTHPDDQEEVKAVIDKLIKNPGKLFPLSLRTKHKNGTYISLEGTVINLLRDENTKAIVANFRDVTEKKKAEQELKTARERVFFHVDNSPLAFIEWDNKIKPTSWSKRAEEIFGWSEKETTAKEFDWISKIYEEDLPWVIEISKELVAGKIGKSQVQHRNYTKDGRVIWCEWFNSILRDKEGKVLSILSLVQDVTERKQTEEKIFKSEEQYRDLVDNITDLICTHDLDGRILSVNRAAEELIAHKFDPQENLNIKDLLAPDKKNMFDDYITQLKEKSRVQGLMKIQTFSGQTRIWEYKNSLKTAGVKTPIVR